MSNWRNQVNIVALVIRFFIHKGHLGWRLVDTDHPQIWFNKNVWTCIYNKYFWYFCVIYKYIGFTLYYGKYHSVSTHCHFQLFLCKNSCCPCTILICKMIWSKLFFEKNIQETVIPIVLSNTYIMIKIVKNVSSKREVAGKSLKCILNLKIVRENSTWI